MSTFKLIYTLIDKLNLKLDHLAELLLLSIKFQIQELSYSTKVEQFHFSWIIKNYIISNIGILNTYLIDKYIETNDEDYLKLQIELTHNI